MQLEGSCHCGAVRFTQRAHTPYPYMRCYCGICRKTAGSGGFAINIMGDHDSLNVTGGEHVTIYQAVIDGEKSDHERHFCRHCGAHLWVWCPLWPELVHPHAAVIDTALPPPPAFVDIMLDHAAPWVVLHEGDNIDRFAGYPAESIEDWHKNRNLWKR